jgi:hypothetical protein
VADDEEIAGFVIAIRPYVIAYGCTLV